MNDLEKLFNTMEEDVALSHMLSRGYLTELEEIVKEAEKKLLIRLLDLEDMDTMPEVVLMMRIGYE